MIKTKHKDWVYDLLIMIPFIVVWSILLNIVIAIGITVGVYFVRKNIKEDKRATLLCILLALLLSLSEFFGQRARELLFNRDNITLNDSLLIMIKSMSTSLMLEPILFYVTKHASVSNDIDRFSKKRFLYYWIVLLIGYIPCILGFYPGLLAYDGHYQWAMGDLVELTTHHPILHTLLIQGCGRLSKLVDGTNDHLMLFYNMVQVPIIISSIAYGMIYLEKLKVNVYLRLGILVFYLVLPVYQILGVSSTKDVMFGVFFLIGSVLLLECLRIQKVKVIKLVIAFTLMNLFRNNSMYAIAILIVLLGMTLKRNKKFKIKLMEVLVLSILLSMLVNKSVQYIVGAKDGDIREMLCIPSQQIARTYCYNKDSEDWDDSKIEECMQVYPSKDMLLAYNVLIADPVKNQIQFFDREVYKERTYSIKEIIKEYIKLGLEYPRDYIDAYLLQNVGLWYSDERTSSVMETVNRIAFTDDYKIKYQVKSKIFNDYYSWFQLSTVYDKLPIVRRLFYAGTYTLINLMCLFVMIVKKQKRYVWLPILLFSYLFTLSLGPCIYTRYVYNVMLVMPILVGVTFGGLKDMGE